MKYSTVAFAVLSLFAASVLADNTTNQESTTISSPTSVMSNTQVNNGPLAYDNYGGGVSCARTTWSVDGIVNEDVGDAVVLRLTGVFGPAFEMSDCESGAKTQNGIRAQQLKDMEAAALHLALENEQILAKNEATLAEVCLELHGKLAAAPGTAIATACQNFSPLLADHHKGKPMNVNLMHPLHRRVSPNALPELR